MTPKSMRISIKSNLYLAFADTINAKRSKIVVNRALPMEIYSKMKR